MIELFNKFTDTIFLKESSDLQEKYNALTKLVKEYPENEYIQEELFIVKKGLEGENEIKYQLSKSNLGMFVLRDINIEYENLKAQIDYVIITKMYCYFIECKNLTGNITVNEKGDFIREYNIKGKKIKKGMYSPLRQVEAQRDVFKKIWNNSLSSNKLINSIKRKLSEDSFTYTYKVLVVATNNETILNTKNAPKDIKSKVIKSDSLIRKIQYDLDNSDKDLWDNKKEMERWANSFKNINKDMNTDYYKQYKEKYINNMNKKEELLKSKLIEFRKQRSLEMNIPAYYIFTNEELDKLVNIKPKTIEELKKANILTAIKIKMHGNNIINIINNY